MGEIELYYESFGESDDQPVLLIAGLGAQCLSWPDGFCAGLADRALQVVRFDSRDIGLSTKLDHLEFSWAAAVAAYQNGEPVPPPYRLDDMADDAVGLLDVLDLDSAHVVGMSLGGMVAQLMAINHPDRVRSLTSIMSTTGNPGVGQPTPEALAVIQLPAATTVDEFIAAGLVQRETWGSPGLLDEAELTQYFRLLWDRDHHPTAAQRHYGAVLAAGDREAALARLDVPTLVVHGDRDTLIAPSGGERTAELIPGARLLMLEGMGHDLPSSYWAPVIEAILQHVVGVPV